MPPPKASVMEASKDTRNSLERPSVAQEDDAAVSKLMDETMPETTPETTASASLAPAPQPTPAPAKPAEAKPPEPKPSGGALGDQTKEPPKPAAAEPAKPPEPTPGPGTQPPPAAPPAGAKPPEPAAPPAGPPADPEIDGIEKPRGLSPKNDGHWETLRAVAKREKAGRIAAEAKAKELEAKVGSLPPEIEAEVKEAREIRRTFNLRNDPYLKETYDKPMEKTKQEIYTLMESCGFSKERIEKMEAAGGPMSHPMDWWRDEIFARLENSDNQSEKTAAVLIENLLKKNIQMTFEREQELTRAVQGQAEWLKKRDEQYVTKAKEEREFIVNQLTEVQKQIPWANPVQEPPNATPEQKAQVAAHNAFYNDTVSRMKVAMNPPNAQARLETALAACLSFKLAQDLDALGGKIKMLEEENGKLKSAGVTRPGPVATPPAGGTKPKSFGDLIKMKNEAAIDAGLEAAGV